MGYRKYTLSSGKHVFMFSVCINRYVDHRKNIKARMQTYPHIMILNQLSWASAIYTEIPHRWASPQTRTNIKVVIDLQSKIQIQKRHKALYIVLFETRCNVEDTCIYTQVTYNHNNMLLSYGVSLVASLTLQLRVRRAR